MAKLIQERYGFAHYCPGCELRHYISVADPLGCNWSFDGDMDQPTFAPSIKHSQPWKDSGSTCHYFIQNGMINYCGDSTHALAGQSIAVPEMPSEAREF